MIISLAEYYRLNLSVWKLLSDNIATFLLIPASFQLKIGPGNDHY